MINREEIAKRMAEAVRISGMQKTKFCKEIPITYQAFFDLLRGARDIPLPIIIVTAHIAGVREEWIRYGEEPMMKCDTECVSKQSKDFLHMYRKLDSENKIAIKRLIEAIKKVNSNRHENEVV